MAISIVTPAQGWSEVVSQLQAGNSVEMQVGTYTGSATAKVKTGQFLRGAGAGLTKVNFTGAASSNAIEVDSTANNPVRNVEISGFELAYTGTTPSAVNGIYIIGASHSSFIDLRIVGFSQGTGFSLLGKQGLGSYYNYVQSVTCGALVSGVLYPNLIGIAVSSPDFGQSGDAGLAYTNSNTLVSCVGLYNQQYGIYAKGTVSLQLIGCNVERSGSGINNQVSPPVFTVLDSSAVGLYVDGCIDTLINGGHFENNPRPPQSAAATAATSSPVFTLNSHGFANGDKVVISGSGTAVNGFNASSAGSAQTVYYVRDASTNTFNLAATSSGAAIIPTVSATGVLIQMAGADIFLAGATGRTTIVRTHLGSERDLTGPKVGSTGDVYLLAETATAPNPVDYSGNWLQKANVNLLSARTVAAELGLTVQSDGGVLNLATGSTAASAENYLYFGSGTADSQRWMRIRYRYGSSNLFFERRNGSTNVWSNILTLDWTNSRVGIGHESPDTLLDVRGAITLAAAATDPPANPDATTAVLYVKNGSELRVRFSNGTDKLIANNA